MARQHQLYEIITTVAPDNTASRRAPDKACMQHVYSHQYEDDSSTEPYLWREGPTPTDPAVSAA